MAQPHPSWQKLYAAAERALGLELWPEAEQLLQQTLAQCPSHAAALHLLGKVMAERNALEEALTLQQRRWIAEQWREARLQKVLGGEQKDQGRELRSYRNWIKHHEPQLPCSTTALHQPVWLLESTVKKRRCFAARQFSSEAA